MSLRYIRYVFEIIEQSKNNTALNKIRWDLVHRETHTNEFKRIGLLSNVQEKVIFSMSSHWIYHVPFWIGVWQLPSQSPYSLLHTFYWNHIVLLILIKWFATPWGYLQPLQPTVFSALWGLCYRMLLSVFLPLLLSESASVVHDFLSG